MMICKGVKDVLNWVSLVQNLRRFLPDLRTVLLGYWDFRSGLTGFIRAYGRFGRGYIGIFTGWFPLLCIG